MGRFVFLFTLMQARSFSPMSEFTGSSIEAKCELVEKYKRACENCASKPVKSLYRVGRYCDLVVSPTRTHLLWSFLQTILKALVFGCHMSNTLLSDIHRRRLNLILSKVLGENLVDSTLNGVSLRRRTL